MTCVALGLIMVTDNGFHFMELDLNQKGLNYSCGIHVPFVPADVDS